MCGGIWTAILVVTGSYETLYTYSILAAWIFYTMSVAAVMVLRRKLPDAARPYRMWALSVDAVALRGGVRLVHGGRGRHAAAAFRHGAGDCGDGRAGLLDVAQGVTGPQLIAVPTVVMRELQVVATKTEEKTGKQKMKLRIPRGSGLTRLILGPTGRIFIILFSLFVIAGLGTFTYFYARYARIIDEKLRAGVFANSAKIFAAPESVSVGDAMTPNDIATDLRRSGYTESRGNPVGYYQIHSNYIEIFPQSDSYFDQEPGLIRFANGKISQIVSLQDNTARNQYQLEPQLIQAISGPAREKRRMVKFHDIPKVLVEAVTSIEDKRFFQHAGFDPIRIMKAVYVDVKEGRKDQGASTLSMQTARMFFLTQDKSWKRKAAEVHHHPATGTEALQRGDFRILRQPGGPGLARHLPHRGLGPGVRSLPGQGTQQHHPARSRRNRRHDPAAGLLRPLPPSRTACATAAISSCC